MLTDLSADRFKSLATLRINLGRINVFIGANGSGKSNLLEALGVLGAAAFGRVDDETLQRRGVRPGVPQLYRTAFPQQRNVPHIGFGAKASNGASFKVTLRNPSDNPSPAWSFKTETLQRAARDLVVKRTTTSAGKQNAEQGLAALKVVELKPGDPALELMDALRNYSIYCPNTPSLRGVVSDMRREPVGLAGGRLPEAVKELLEAARKNEALTEPLDDVRNMIDWAEDFSAASSVDVPSSSAAHSPLVIQFIDRFMAEGRNG